MAKRTALLAVVLLVGCATNGSGPAVEPTSEPSPSVMAPPEPEPATTSRDLAFFAERMAEAVSVVVAGFFLTPDYKAQE